MISQINGNICYLLILILKIFKVKNGTNDFNAYIMKFLIFFLWWLLINVKLQFKMNIEIHKIKCATCNGYSHFFVEWWRREITDGWPSDLCVFLPLLCQRNYRVLVTPLFFTLALNRQPRGNLDHSLASVSFCGC